MPLCTCSDGQYYVLKGNFSFSLLLLKRAVEKSLLAVLLFAVEILSLKYKGRLLHCLASLLSHCSYS